MPPIFRHSSGYTLLELLVNIAIIGILVAIAIPAYNAFRERAKVAQVRSDLRNIQVAIEQLANDTEKWPGPNDVGETANKEIWDLNKKEAGLVEADSKQFPNWRGPYLSSVSKDPWGSNYFFDPDYEIKGVDYPVIGSFGPDKCCKNTYNSDDVYQILPTP